MTSRYLARAAVTLCSCTFAGGVHAQTTQTIIDFYDQLRRDLPESGDVRLDVGASNQIFHVDDADLSLNHLNLDILQTQAPQQFAAATAAGTTFGFGATTNVHGALLRLRYVGTLAASAQGQGQGTLAISLPCKTTFAPGDTAGYFISPTGVTRSTSDYYGVYFTSTAYQPSLDAYRAFLRNDAAPSGYMGTQQFSSTEFRTSAYSCYVQDSSVNPLVGNAESVQFQAVTDGLDFTTPSVEGGETDWGIGLRIGQVRVGGQSGVQYDARVNRSWRVLSGNRALLSVDVPISYQVVHGDRQLRVYAAAALALPLKRWWTITPRVAYGYANAPDQEIKGQIATATLATTFFLNSLVGRGALSVGGLVGYTRVSHIEFAGATIDAKTENVAFRTGIAYELPLKRRVAGRGVSVRGSYAFTTFTGDRLYMKSLHEVTASAGVRSRGVDQRNTFELFRVGLIGKFGEGYRGLHVFAGYRF